MINLSRNWQTLMDDHYRIDRKLVGFRPVGGKFVAFMKINSSNNTLNEG